MEPHETQTDPAESDRLDRPRDGRLLGGVAAGLAEYFDLDATVVRIGFVALALLGGAGIPLYLAGWLLIPEKGSPAALLDDLLRPARAR